ncbi:hypothetical protein LJC68_06810 [Bacteroidales bacterium OttesenSCG-928-B11]|nr:hypothetical protein [Bacteroidales bacterium OttesenSCG-928-E04]MDL2312571.1 hypothetical protein [Bacteroidales bacterium OttesenSCG-928-B11]MDL2325834.1 hypothetical protein [Bacteroidales bacterium OttesenSCG-928-A14]
MLIPKIIHQIWSGVEDPLPDMYSQFSETWRRDYPDWRYELWDHERIISFMDAEFPEHKHNYDNFPYNIQRWDAIRYLILYRLGGMYVDFDYESLKNITPLIEDKTCCFALEPEHQYWYFKKNVMFNNALMLSVPEHPFMGKIIEHVFSSKILEYPTTPKESCVLNTTGPWKLIELYESIDPTEQEEIYLVPSEFVTPIDGFQAKTIRKKLTGETRRDWLKAAYAIHYFCGGWRENEA